MDEPKKDLLIAAAKKKYPGCSAVTVNQRKHTMRITIDVQAKTHAELLQKLKA